MPDMDLSQIQTKFQSHITRKNTDIDDDFASLYRQGNIPLPERLRVYRDNIIGGLATILRDTYTGVTALTGEDFTMALLRQYIRGNLPETGCLDDYGHDLPDFIQGYEPAKSLPYLPDIARLDWALSACEHAPDDRPMTPDDLLSLEINDETALPLRTSVYLISSDFPVLSIRNFALDPDHAQKPAPDLSSGPEYVLVYRPYLKAESVQISEEELTFLQYLQQEAPLNDALEKQLSAFQDFDLTSFLQKFMKFETFRK